MTWLMLYEHRFHDRSPTAHLAAAPGRYKGNPPRIVANNPPRSPYAANFAGQEVLRYRFEADHGQLIELAVTVRLRFERPPAGFQTILAGYPTGGWRIQRLPDGRIEVLDRFGGYVRSAVPPLGRWIELRWVWRATGRSVLQVGDGRTATMVRPLQLRTIRELWLGADLDENGQPTRFLDGEMELVVVRARPQPSLRDLMLVFGILGEGEGEDPQEARCRILTEQRLSASSALLLELLTSFETREVELGEGGGLLFSRRSLRAHAAAVRAAASLREWLARRGSPEGEAAQRALDRFVERFRDFLRLIQESDPERFRAVIQQAVRLIQGPHVGCDLVAPSNPGIARWQIVEDVVVRVLDELSGVQVSAALVSGRTQ